MIKYVKIIYLRIGCKAILLILAIINGVIRETVYAPKIGELPAHQISSVMFMGIIVLITYIFIKLINIEATNSQYILLGIM